VLFFVGRFFTTAKILLLITGFFKGIW
jgi:hypothetical protein